MANYTTHKLPFAEIRLQQSNRKSTFTSGRRGVDFRKEKLYGWRWYLVTEGLPDVGWSGNCRSEEQALARAEEHYEYLKERHPVHFRKLEGKKAKIPQKQITMERIAELMDDDTFTRADMNRYLKDPDHSNFDDWYNQVYKAG